MIECKRKMNRYLHSNDGNSENHHDGKIMSVIFFSFTRVNAGSLKNISKHMNIPNRTPKSESKKTTSGTLVIFK